MSTGDSSRVLEILLSQMTSEDRERLLVAWERHAQGDPDSLPALYALADRFSLTAHAALLERQESLLVAFQSSVANTQFPSSERATKKTRVWLKGTLCCLAAAATGAAVARQFPVLPTFAGGDGNAMMEQIRAAGGDLMHRVSRREGKLVHILELRCAASPPEAYLTPEHHGVIVFEHQPASDPRK